MTSPELWPSFEGVAALPCPSGPFPSPAPRVLVATRIPALRCGASLGRDLIHPGRISLTGWLGGFPGLGQGWGCFFSGAVAVGKAPSSQKHLSLQLDEDQTPVVPSLSAWSLCKPQAGCSGAQLRLGGSYIPAEDLEVMPVTAPGHCVRTPCQKSSAHVPKAFSHLLGQNGLFFLHSPGFFGGCGKADGSKGRNELPPD